MEDHIKQFILLSSNVETPYVVCQEVWYPILRKWCCVTQQNQADGASSKETCSFLSTILLHKHFGLQAYGLVTSHSPCFLWVFSISWLPEYYQYQRTAFLSYSILDSKQNPHQQVLIITVREAVPLWYLLWFIHSDTSRKYYRRKAAFSELV